MHLSELLSQLEPYRMLSFIIVDAHISIIKAIAVVFVLNLAACNS